jgi:23S rRNA (cytosine1962-C5)-methyltransferase
MDILKLKSGHDRRVKRGHPWVYSNEIDVAATSLKGVTPGAIVRVVDSGGELVGHGHASPANLIAVRLLSRDEPFGGPVGEAIDDTLITRRLERALRWRDRLYTQPHYRWVYGEGDELPGLVVDRYGDACVVQTSTWGMEAALDRIVAAIDTLIAPATLVVKNTNSARVAEGLPAYVDVRRGNPQALVVEGDATFEVNLAEGQKTGWFFDQADNRSRFPQMYRGARVLDLYSYVGGWGVRAALRGASRVVCVDSSEAAVAATRANAIRNAVGETVTAVRADVTDFLKDHAEEYDIVILDPPALVRRRKDLKSAAALYRHLNRTAIARLAPGGMLVTCSCSAQLDAETHLGIVRAGARQARRDLVVVGRGSMPPDHPIHPLITESEYLKCIFLRAQ